VVALVNKDFAAPCLLSTNEDAWIPPR
jgi:hypothetical protein